MTEDNNKSIPLSRLGKREQLWAKIESAFEKMKTFMDFSRFDPVPSDYWDDKERKKRSQRLTLPYLAVVVLVMLGVAFVNRNPFNPGLQGFWWGCGRVACLVVGLIIVLAPTLYWWLNATEFEAWLVHNKDNKAIKVDFEKERFKTNSEAMRAIWAAILGTFIALLLKGG